MGKPRKTAAGRWIVEVPTARGRGASKTSRTFDTKREAERWATETRARVQGGTWSEVRGGDITLDTYAQAWLDRLRRAPGTVDNYRATWKRMQPGLGDLRLDQLRRSNVQTVLESMSGAASTRRKDHAILSMILKAAIADGHLAVSPLAGIKPPTVTRRQVQVLTRDELHALLAAAGSRHRPMLTVAAGTGLRQAELFGIRRANIDFLRRTLAVEEQVTTGRGRPPTLTTTLKTPASRRRLPLPDVVVQALAQVLEDRPDADALFVSPRSGSLWGRQHFNTTVWKPALTAAGLPHELGLHVLRHTYASHLIAAGHHPRLIQARLGHASIVETMDTYGHLFPESENETRTALEALLERRPTDKPLQAQGGVPDVR